MFGESDGRSQDKETSPEIAIIRDILLKDLQQAHEARLDKIAAGTHYVTRLADWSEKQDLFQADTLRRLNDLTDRVKRLEGDRPAA